MSQTAKYIFIIFLLYPYLLMAQPDSLWSNFYGGRGYDQGSAIIQTSDGGFAIAGDLGVLVDENRRREDGALLKIDSEGNEQFIQLFGGNSRDRFWGLIQLEDNGFLIIGTTASFGNGGEDGWVVRTDENGEEIWSRTYGDENRNAFTAIKAFDDEFVISGIAGTEDRGDDIWFIGIDDDGELLWSETYGSENRDYCGGFVQDTDGGFLLCGYTYPEAREPKDGYVIKVNSDHEEVWSRIIGTEESDGFLSIVKTNIGCAMAGFTGNYVNGGNSEFYLVNLDHDGEIIWTRTYGGYTHELAYSLALTPEGGFLMGGFTNSYGSGSSDFYLVRTDSDGEQLWHDYYGVSGADNCYDVINCEDGGYILTGRTSNLRREDVILDNIWIVKTGTDILRMLSITDTSFAQNDTLKLDASWFTQFVVPEVYLDSALTLEIEAGDLIHTSLDNDTLYLWSESEGLDSLLIRFYEDDDEGNFDEAWFHVLVTEPNSIDEPTNIPLRIALMNAYPNPFNSTTTIAYNLSKSMEISLSIYDLSGREITTLVSGYKNAGFHTVNWHANAPTGLYFYKLKSGSFEATKRLILIR